MPSNAPESPATSGASDVLAAPPIAPLERDCGGSERDGAPGLLDLPPIPSVRPPAWQVMLCGLLALGLIAPFLGKAVHIDDANFLMLAEGAARDLWRPHNISLNWMGTTQRAFEVLSNPPGIAWWLAPVRNQSEFVMHLWMQLWLLPAGWGAWTLARRVAPEAPLLTTACLLTCPVVVLSSQSLLPDLPLLACTLAGFAGFVTRPRGKPLWALLAGCAVLFRYSGPFLWPTLFWAGWRLRRGRGLLEAAPVLAPTMLLAVHDLHAYGDIHALAMLGFQNDGAHKSGDVLVHNLLAAVAMLGGAGLLPVLAVRRAAAVWALVGGAAGFVFGWLTQHPPASLAATVLAAAAGAAVLKCSFDDRTHEPVLALWLFSGLAVFVISRFAATRYWLPFLPGGLLLLASDPRNRIRLPWALALNVLVALGMAIDDWKFAQAHRDAAERVAALGTGSFSGHWGWQHYLERRGWRAVERGGPPDALHAAPEQAYAQPTDPNVALEVVETFVIPDDWWGPRVHSSLSRAAYHSGGPERYAPWNFANDPYEEVTVSRRVDASTPQGDRTDRGD